MANPDDQDFDLFVADVLNASFSTTLGEMEICSDREDELIHNISESESDTGDTDNTSTNQTSPAPPPLTTPLDVRGQQPPLTPATTITQTTARPPNAATHSHWIDVTDTDPGPSHTIPIYNVNSGPSLPASFDDATLPIEYFQLFFNDDIMTHICNETNLYANKRRAQTNSPRARLNDWKDITPVELKAFFGTIINMGLIPLPAIENYFSLAWERRIPFFRDVFNRDEFLNIFWNLHFNHIGNENATVRRGFLISPVLEHMKNMSRLFYNTSSHVSVDESTISFKGRVAFRCYNPNKPTKYGLKVFVVSDSKNGYIYDFLPYYGPETLIQNTNLLKTTQIVKVLTESIVLKDPSSPAKGLHVYTDRYYTSPELAEELLKIGCLLTGTVMTHRTGLPPGMKARGKKMKKGDITSKRKGSTLVVSWKDKRVVHMLSTFSNGSKHDMTDVASKWPNRPPTKKPEVVLDYIKYMGGVDRSDHFISSYQFMRRTKKWYRKMFFWLFEVAIINSYVLYKETQKRYSKKPMTHHQFRMSLLKSLVAEKLTVARPKAKKRGRPAEGPPEQRLDGRQHFMDRREKGSSKCVMCTKNGLRRETIYFCKTCALNPPLHPDKCFEQYHTVPNI